MTPPHWKPKPKNCRKNSWSPQTSSRNASTKTLMWRSTRGNTKKRYDSLTARFDTAKARLEEIETAIADKKSRRAAIESFLDTLAQADLMEKFDPVLWCGLVDFVTVYDRNDVRFTFKDGREVKA